MAASAHRSVDNPQSLGRLWWLPFRGQGNGLDDAGWAPIADVDASIVSPLLAELAAAGVPAHTALVPVRPSQLLRGQPASGARYRLWVGTSAYSRGEDLLRVRIPVLSQATA
ncbi:MAG TPA: hypothetical protein VMA73_05165 [Streptosporangiaceae bacterium]|nr:hypothetical protein [Streptosporangiaceae bacterium]